MPEIPQNTIPRQWVIISTERARRPDQFASEEGLRVELPPRVATCPFCPGNESKTPPETFRDPQDGPWRVRVVPNKFGALSSDGQLVRMNVGIKRTISGVGRHGVIVETPEHNQTLARVGEDEGEGVLRAHPARYHARLAHERGGEV